MKLRYYVIGIVTLTLFSVAAQDAWATEFRAPTLGDALRGAGLSLPPEWAGVWAENDSVHFCSDPTILFASAGFDTLCTGETIEENAGDVTLSCTGTIDANNANITCTGTDEPEPGCIATYDMTIVATRNGDDSFSETTLNTTYEPELCDGAPNSCLVIERTSNRVGPEPPECSSPVQSGTWGMVKARYR